MTQTGLGTALKTLRERRTLSLREVSTLSKVDHAYVHRLETGEKVAPSPELLSKLVRVLKANERDQRIVYWLVEHPDADPVLVRYTMQAENVSAEEFMMAAGIRHRGTARPDPATLIERIRRILNDDD